MSKFCVTKTAPNSEHVVRLDIAQFTRDYDLIQFLKDIEKDWTHSFSFSDGNLTGLGNLFTLHLSYLELTYITVSISYKLEQIPWKFNEKYHSIRVNNVNISFVGETDPGISSVKEYIEASRFLQFDPSFQGFSVGRTYTSNIQVQHGYREIIITVNVTKRSEGSVELVSEENPMIAIPNVFLNKTVNTNFPKYLFSEKLSDCKVKAGEKEFPAHRLVLTEISGFCERMFSTEMIESQKGIWKIDDFDPSVVHEFLEFAYTGTSESLTSKKTDILKELFRMAHKYDIVPLKIQCESLLTSLINCQNVLSLYNLGFLYESKSLMVFAKTHFNRFKLQILPNTEALSELQKNYPADMVYELMITKIEFTTSEHIFRLDLPKFSKDYNFIKYLKDIEKDWTCSFSFSNGNLADVENLFTFSIRYGSSNSNKHSCTVSLKYKIKRVPWKDNENQDSIIIGKTVQISFTDRRGEVNSFRFTFDQELEEHIQDFHFGVTKKVLHWDDDDDDLEILITVIASKRPEGSVKIVPVNLKSFPNILEMETLKTSFSKYFLEEKLSDCKVVVGDKVFPAHRFVLTELSAFCERMFSTDMMENQNREWKIDDFDVVVVHEFLEFAYTGTTKNLTSESKNAEILKELFRIGHKYDVVPLKIQCEYLLTSLINIENVASLYHLGFVHESESLTTAAKMFFNRFKLQILPNTNALSELYKTYPADMIYELAIK